jgi:hypothetical protein
MDREGAAIHVTIVTMSPVRIAAQGTLAPNASYRYHRIYLDLAAATPVMARTQMESAPPKEMAVPEGHVQEHTAATHESAARMEPGEHADHADQAEHGEHAEHSEHPLVTAKLGGAGEWSRKGGEASAGPTIALQKAVFGDRLEIEAGTTPLFKDGHATWKSGLIVKKPFELSEHVEAELGAGPLWLHKTAPDEKSDSAGAEAVAEMVYWPGEHHRFGWYLEGGYAYDFGKGHEQSGGVGAGILIGIP